MGLHHAWIVTPGLTDGDGGGNRHIVQHRAAIASLLAALQRVSHDRIFCFNISECQIVADPHRALLAGHGHAGWLALLLGAAMPDRALGVMAMAPHDRPPTTGFLAEALDPSMRAVLDRQQGWRRGERVGQNLEGVPVYISVYENDTTVCGTHRTTHRTTRCTTHRTTCRTTHRTTAYGTLRNLFRFGTFLARVSQAHAASRMHTRARARRVAHAGWHVLCLVSVFIVCE